MSQNGDKLASLRKELREVKKERASLKHKMKLYERYELKAIKPITVKEYDSIKDEHGVVLAGLSDIHGEERITLAQTNGLNYLSPSETERRLSNYANNLVQLCKIFRKDINLSELVWAWLGDVIHGFIHEEYIRTNYMTPVEASVWMTDQLRKVLDFVLVHGNFSRVVIVCKIGNHSRITNKIYTDEEAKHSYEWGIYHTLAGLYPAVEWIIDESYFTYLTVYGKVLRFHHGHAFRYLGGIGGIHIPLMRYIAKINRQRRADMDIMGHWHTRTFDATNGYLINGSICGSSPYSIRLGFPIEDPTQFFQILDHKRGFTINAPILVKQ